MSLILNAARRLPAGTLCCLLLTPLSLHAAQASALIINDVTQLNPIAVKQVLQPRSTQAIIQAVKSHPGPIAIGGGRYSMGGQTATEQALQLDMRQFNQVVRFIPQEKEITVQSGITWREIQETIDPHNLSVKIMQSYANFTVGGSLSVNAHGRYIGQGPLVLSVKRISIVLADGRLLEASPNQNAELFYGAIGGYGALGVITEATLALSDNEKILRDSQVMPLNAYRDYFWKNIRNRPNIIFHNADIYPGDYQTLRATSFSVTNQALTNPSRLVQHGRDYRGNRLLLSGITYLPGGKKLRERWLDPLRFKAKQVIWRNYEASLDVRELEPASRKNSTYVLQEYFVPPAQLENFVRNMGQILRQHRVNVINISIRHAKVDPGTTLAWARQEVFSLVLYYQQDTKPTTRAKVGQWTRQLIDHALAAGGSYYLPYQIHATEAQFKAAYPQWQSFFAQKTKLDPSNKFRNKLWDAYYPEMRPKP